MMMSNSDMDCKGVVCSVESDSQLQPLRLVVTVIWIVRGLCVLWIMAAFKACSNSDMDC